MKCLCAVVAVDVATIVNFERKKTVIARDCNSSMPPNDHKFSNFFVMKVHVMHSSCCCLLLFTVVFIAVRASTLLEYSQPAISLRHTHRSHRTKVLFPIRSNFALYFLFVALFLSLSLLLSLYLLHFFCRRLLYTILNGMRSSFHILQQKQQDSK